jgi:hypothetical protein
MHWERFVFVYLLQIAASAPTFFSTCAAEQRFNASTLALYFIHHLTDVFLFWGVFFVSTRTEALLHLLFILITGTHWFLNGNRCIATEALNARCGYPRDAWLDSLLNRTELRRRSEYYQFLWLGVTAIYDIWKLVKN